ncbi:unnamed protein product, partial [Mesorhabditis spiculigera]
MAHEEEDWFHGLLPREDLAILLRNPGDYLLRISQVKPTEERKLILSLAYINDKKSALSDVAGHSAGLKRNTAPPPQQPPPPPPHHPPGGLSGEARDGIKRRKHKKRAGGSMEGGRADRPRPPAQPDATATTMAGANTTTAAVPTVIRNLTTTATTATTLNTVHTQMEEPRVALGHYIIVKEKDPPNHYTIDNTLKGETVRDLVENYRTRRIPLKKEVPNTLLVTPVTRAPWELRHEHVKTETKLGEGAFGDVYSGKLKMHDGAEIEVAVKLAHSQAMDKEKIKELMKEARLMRNFAHPNVVRIYGVAVEKEPLMIVMELVDGNALDKFLKLNGDKLERVDKLAMILDAAWGIEYLHHKKIIHRDIASRNCLVANSLFGRLVKISDFGLSREGDEYCLKKARKIAIKWLSPETLTTFIFTRRSDVWAYGVLIWEIYANGEEPYPGVSVPASKQMVLSGQRPVFPEGTPPEVVSLVTADIWEVNVEKRITMTAIALKLEALTQRSPPDQQNSVRKCAATAPSPANGPLHPAHPVPHQQLRQAPTKFLPNPPHPEKNARHKATRAPKQPANPAIANSGHRHK